MHAVVRSAHTSDSWHDGANSGCDPQLLFDGLEARAERHDHAELAPQLLGGCGHSDVGGTSHLRDRWIASTQPVILVIRAADSIAQGEVVPGPAP